VDSLPLVGRLLVTVPDDLKIDKHLGRYLDERQGQTSPHHTLVVAVDTVPSTKWLHEVIVCQTPPLPQLVRWAQRRLEEQHKILPADAAQLLVEESGQHLGLLTQEIAKLAVAVPGGRIERSDVDQLVCRNRERSGWDLAGTLAQGGNVFAVLEDVFAEKTGGEEDSAARRCLEALSRLLRQAVATTRIYATMKKPPDALEAMKQAGVASWHLDQTAALIKLLAQRRLLKHVYPWLLDAEMDFRSSMGGKMALQRLLGRLTKQAG
jgi:DNA polymerase III delta subunit